MEILKVKDLVVNYGMIKAVKGASFCVNQGEIVALIGANGAGKTSILHTVTGLLSAKEGSIEFDGKDITKTKAHDIVKLGMAHVPEGRRVFGDLTVIENLKLGAYIRNDKAGIEESLEKIYKRFPRLSERKTQIAGTLSGGEQQMLAMGRGLMSSPELILLDENIQRREYYLMYFANNEDTFERNRSDLLTLVGTGKNKLVREMGKGKKIQVIRKLNNMNMLIIPGEFEEDSDEKYE